MDQIVKLIATDLTLPASRIESILAMLADGSTIPFLARYRKEQTGNLDETILEQIVEKQVRYEEFFKRQEFVTSKIKEMEKLTPELEKTIKNAKTLQELEDIYAPFKSKRKTKAQVARENGLEIVLEAILKWRGAESDRKTMVETLVKEKDEIKVETLDEAITGALDILVENIAKDPDLRESLRNHLWSEGLLSSTKSPKAEENAKPEEIQKYRDYFEFTQKLSLFRDGKNTHRFMAIRRGRQEKILRMEVQFDEERILENLRGRFLESKPEPSAQFEKTIKRALNTYLMPSMELEIYQELKNVADDSAIQTFQVNLKELLLAPYLGAKPVIGLDPGVRTGVKLAIIGANGEYLHQDVLYPHPPKNDIAGTIHTLEAMCKHFKIEHIVIGNGTYGRETFDILKKSFAPVAEGKIQAVLVDESGASIYSASPIARQEFPDLDVTVRGAISIARRFQDPLAELVKIDAKSIGVGQYQHDVNQVKLKRSLDRVVDNCVGYVGVDVNTASKQVLEHVSGVTSAVATNILKFRKEKGIIKNREDLKQVTRLTDKVYEQAVGFLRVPDSQEPLDQTFVHTENYPAIREWCQQHSITTKELCDEKDWVDKLKSDQAFAEKVGEFTHKDIIQSIQNRGQDPRTEFEPVGFSDDIREIGDIQVGGQYTGVVTNITQFGAFVDIGIKENGLIHISQMSDQFVENPLEVLKVGQKVSARVIEVDSDRKRIALSLKSDAGGQSGQAGGASRSGRRPGSRASGQQGSNNKNRKQNPRENVQFRNNAFSALKNLKLK